MLFIFFNKQKIREHLLAKKQKKSAANEAAEGLDFPILDLDDEEMYYENEESEEEYMDSPEQRCIKEDISCIL